MKGTISSRMEKKGLKRVVVENLESRRLYSGTPTISFLPQADGTNILQVMAPRHTHDTIEITQPTFGVLDVFDAGTFEGQFAASSGVVVYAVQGAKEIDIDQSVTENATVVGGVGADTLLGGSGYNFLDDAHVGNNLLVDGRSQNWVDGGWGQDSIIALSGADTVYSGTGGSEIWVNNQINQLGYDYIENNGNGAVQYVDNFQGYYGLSNGQMVYQQPGLRRNGTSATFAEPGTITQDEPNGAASTINVSIDPLFESPGPSIQDVNQGDLGDCYFVSSLANIAMMDPNQIRQNITPLGDGTFAVHFVINGFDEYFRVDGNIPCNSNGTPDYNNFTATDATWVNIYEKAFAEARPNPNNGSTNYLSYADYGNIEAGKPTESFQDLGFSAYMENSNDFSNTTQLLNTVSMDKANGEAVEFDTTDGNPGTTTANELQAAGLIGGHAYTVLGVTAGADGQEDLVVRNPWGVGAANDGVVSVPVSLLPGTFTDIIISYV